ncbi:hypothetical protein CS063_11250 [Sporanaerobium hydrogeniformans]|uniref:Uncharacterized protein n=1 Tax=Sporanaerobium hydrogeniformans TaxID=3072179 RepID=A0AC61DBZ2_9FIRM|nr:tripartite tricarboxylate transporter TctB family protein [Sporanaerobium hydrogeniformans]PHV70238.1 hypothetical protein CS063_11250 [Sporanaerobium hydrogeniformans]
MDNMRKWNYIISLITAILGAILIFLSSQLGFAFNASGPGAGFWPGVLGGILVVLAVALFGTSLIKGKGLEEVPVVLNSPANKRVYSMMGIIVIYCILLKTAGFYLSTLLFIPSTMYLMEVRDKKKLIIMPLVTVIFIYIVFGILLKTKLPMPIFMN